MTGQKDLHLNFPPFRVMFMSDFVFHQILAIFGTTLYTKCFQAKCVFEKEPAGWTPGEWLPSRPIGTATSGVNPAKLGQSGGRDDMERWGLVVSIIANWQTDNIATKKLIT